MQNEVIARGATVEEAMQKAILELGVPEGKYQTEIIEAPKKGLFGKLKGEAVVKAFVIASTTTQTLGSCTKLEIATKYLREIIDAMGLVDVTFDIKETNDGATITFNGEGIAVLIGHHGETLDALQYLIALTCNRIDGDYYRITLDCGDYREKREQTLVYLAKRIAEKTKKTGKSQFLEPMNPYERRIIHSVVSDLEGVTSKSRGEEPNRKVVIMCTSTKPPVTFRQNTNRKEDALNVKKPYVPYKKERSMEDILKNDFKDKEEGAELYSKFEF